ncbi:thermonuclease family protein [Solitalea lacus]|uniref:thermonuclease family protein n=1 Tax=Solitalea lacus TaxID=2911172 RepID=UPI001EDC3E58|nr:thermonuclease family protein [Solitalea lacus]UKJ06817.1 thermonuclease family protein [Solitalea lacus]
MHVILFLVFFLNNLLQGEVTGKVISVADGDTITILTSEKVQVKIRLHGIDCPEKSQPFGMAAKKYTSNLVFERFVKVKITDVDRYGRSVGLVYLNNNKVLNEEILSAGYAWHYIKYDQNPAWDRLEIEARRKKIGVWSQPNAIEPWIWRKNKSLHQN